MYVNINIEKRFDLCVLHSQIVTPTNSMGGGAKLVFVDYSRYFVTINLRHTNYLVCRARPGGATLSLFFSCMSWKRRDIIVNVLESLCKVSVLFVCLQIKCNVFDILIKSAPYKISKTFIQREPKCSMRKDRCDNADFRNSQFFWGWGSLKIQLLPRRVLNVYQIPKYMLNDV